MTTIKNPFVALAVTAAFGLFAATSVEGSLILTDHPQGAAADTFYNSLTEVVAGNTPPGNNRFGLDAGDDEGQSFTLAAPITLDSIYLGYNDQQSTGTFNLIVNVDNDGSDDYTFPVSVTNALQSGGDNNGPFHFLQFGLSSENIALGAGVHSFRVVGITDNGEGGFLIGPNFSNDNYGGGQMLSNASRDLIFAVTAVVPEPSSLALLGIAGLLIGLYRRHCSGSLCSR